MNLHTKTIHASFLFAILFLHKARLLIRYPRTCRVVDLIIYPVKGLQGCHLDSVKLFERGLEYDRQFMIVDGATRNFVSQRKYPQMSTLRARILQGDTLELTSFDETQRLLVNDFDKGESVTVTIWSVVVPNAKDQGDTVSAWISN